MSGRDLVPRQPASFSKETFMKLDIQKLDERIKKLQEIRRIAADPEMVSILLEFILPEDDSAMLPPSPAVAAGNGAAPPSEDEVEGLLKGVTATTPAGGNIWGSRRG